MLGMGYFISLWHSLSLNYLSISEMESLYSACVATCKCNLVSFNLVIEHSDVILSRLINTIAVHISFFIRPVSRIALQIILCVMAICGLF